jgi:quinol monooxygenase YgiN
MMGQVLVRYRLKPDQVERNEELIRAMYEELDRAAPSGLRYVIFKLEDGVSFMHISESEGEESPMAGLASVQEFRRELADRCEEQPVLTQLTEVGSYRSGAE